MKLYEVTKGRSSLHILAENSAKAKREYCRRRGIKPNDYWCGVSMLSAKEVKAPKEVAV